MPRSTKEMLENDHHASSETMSLEQYERLRLSNTSFLYSAADIVRKTWSIIPISKVVTPKQWEGL